MQAGRIARHTTPRDLESRFEAPFCTDYVHARLFGKSLFPFPFFFTLFTRTIKSTDVDFISLAIGHIDVLDQSVTAAILIISYHFVMFVLLRILRIGGTRNISQQSNAFLLEQVWCNFDEETNLHKLGLVLLEDDFLHEICTSGSD